jgi:cytochrome P450
LPFDGGNCGYVMSEQSLYDADILLWSEQQAEVIRRLGRTRRDVSNELDVENVAEEIESVGRSELAAVESLIRLVFVHLMKLALEPGADATRHWRGEIVAFHSEARRRYAPSMRQRLDLDKLWRSASEQVTLSYEGTQELAVANLSIESPIAIEDLLEERIDISRLMQRVGAGEAKS